MSEIITMTVEELSSLVLSIVKSFWRDLIFPTPQRYSPIEQIDYQIKSQEKMLLSGQDQICSQAGIIQTQAREIQRLTDALSERDRVIERMNTRIRDLESSQF